MKGGGAFSPRNRGDVREEEPGEDKGLGPRAELLPRSPPEEPAPPISKAGQVVVKKIKTQ